MSDSFDKLGDGLKKVLLAGIGAAAISGEKAQEVLGKLVEKGELTVEQGKALNEELKHNLKEKKESKEKPVEEKRAEIEETLKNMTEEQLDGLKALLNAIKPDEKKEEEAPKDKADEEKPAE